MHITLEKLQNKSEEQKAFIAVVVAVVVTATLFLGWGYNFAHSNNVSNLASSASGVAQVVENANIAENMSDIVNKFKEIGFLDDASQGKKEDTVADTQPEGSVSRRHINVFATPFATPNEPQQIQNYGENAGDVLY